MRQEPERNPGDEAKKLPEQPVQGSKPVSAAVNPPSRRWGSGALSLPGLRGIMLIAATLPAHFHGMAHADIVSGMPDAIVCSVRDPTGALPWDRLVFYVSAYTIDGRTLYKTLTSDPVVLLVSSDGVVSGGNLADCNGRTIEALIDAGKAITFSQSPPSVDGN